MSISMDITNFYETLCNIGSIEDFQKEIKRIQELDASLSFVPEGCTCDKDEIDIKVWEEDDKIFAQFYSPLCFSCKEYHEKNDDDFNDDCTDSRLAKKINTYYVELLHSAIYAKEKDIDLLDSTELNKLYNESLRHGRALEKEADVCYYGENLPKDLQEQINAVDKSIAAIRLEMRVRQKNRENEFDSD